MDTTDIISIIALIVSAIALAISLLIYLTTLTRLGVKIALYKNEPYYMSLTIINESDKSISFLGVSFYQGDKIVIGKFSNYVLNNLDAPTTSIVRYLAPYQADQINIEINFDNFDKARPIRMHIKTSRRSLSYWLDLSDVNNPVVYKYRYYRKHNTNH